jgi:hypothetical protein
MGLSIMTEEGQAPASPPARKITLREMREAAEHRTHQDVMVRLACEVGPPFAANPRQYALAEALEAIVRQIDLIKSDRVMLDRMRKISGGT